MKYLIGDIGNTLTKVSLLDKNLRIIKIINLETKKINKINFMKIFFKNILTKDMNKKILFSSVVPITYKKIKSYLQKKKYSVLEIKELKIKKMIKFNIDKYSQLGSDRIANSIGSLIRYNTNCLVIDFGTATTFDIIKKSKVYEGGVIAPGIKLSINNLNKYTASLPIFKLRSNTRPYGKNTLDALNAGFLWGYQGLINNIIKKIILASKTNYKVILTGGYANFFKKYVTNKSSIDENITIKGIIEIYKRLLL